MYVPSIPGASAPAILTHEGEVSPVPELADLVRAEEFLARVSPEVRRLKEAAPELAAVEVPSRAPDCRLIGVLSSPSARVPDRRQAARGPRGDAETGADLGPAVADLWLGLRMADEDTPMRLPPRPDGPRAVDTEWGWLLGFAGELARHTRRVSQILDDPVTGLPGRAEFQVDLERAVDMALERDRPVTLLMVNPDDFGAVNERISREAADDVIRELAARLQASQRISDRVARYGGVIFASILADTGGVEGRRRAEEILERLHGQAFIEAGVPLRFSLGLACREPGDQGVRRALDLIRRADAALSAAKLAGGGRIVAWQPGPEEEVGPRDRLTGIFTGQMAKDYRNMAVLSDTISVLAVSVEPHILAERVVTGLRAALKPERVGLFELGTGAAPQLIYGVVRRGPAAAATVQETLILGDDERRFLEAARQRRQPLEARAGEGPGEMLSFAVPLLAGGDVLGVLYLAGRAGSMSLDSSDLVFLEALATQVALALDRARLTERQRRREEQERQRLQAEVEELRTALRQNQILYRSAEMEQLLDRVRRVAPTDATVLITGESGTGKEVFARAIHELSPRRDQPFVVVDCGAIPTTLIESELFGHEKGAFTGAQQRQPGRLVQADRGTVLLDEIGELPLEAQSRLLRFVQEKHVTPVGGRAGRTVDVRVLAATNRDLLVEVEGGSFRADLYHRLNVVRMEIPPLRGRPDDVRHLADHFCRMYSLLYGRPPFSFSPEAESSILRHSWPGNVRELQNRVMRAVILAQGETLSASDLGLAEGAQAPAVAGSAMTGSSSTAESPAVDKGPGPRWGGAVGDAWQELRAGLRHEVEQALRGPGPLAPLGRWLVEDLVLEANLLGGGVASRGAALLGIPVTTFRRRLEGSVTQAGAGWSSPRPPSWPGVRACLAGLLRGPEAASQDLMNRVPQVLIEEVLVQAPDTPRTGAALLGVSLPTFRRRCESLAAERPSPKRP